MHFLIDPIEDKLEFEFFLDEIDKAFNGGKPVALIQILESEIKEQVGNKILVRENGDQSGILFDKELDKISSVTIKKYRSKGWT